MKPEDRILKTLDENGILSLSEIAEYAQIKAVDCNIMLEDMAETNQVYYVGDDSWQIQ